MKLQGIFADITTPFDHKGDIYKVKVQHNVEKWNQTTLAGYVVCGAAGEGALLAAEDKITVWTLVAKHAGPEKLLIAATGAPGVHETVALSNQAADLGYKAVLVESRHADAATQSLYFHAVADQSRIPVIVSAATSPHPNIVAVYNLAGQPRHPDMQVVVTDTTRLWPALQSGAAGAILAFSSAAPYATIAIWEAYRTREEEAGRDWQDRIARAAELVSSRRHGVPGLKHAMDLNAYYGGPPRLPSVVPTASMRREIEEAFRDLPADR